MIDTLFDLQQQVIDGNANALEAYINESSLQPFLNNTECQNAPSANERITVATTANQLISKKF